MAVVVLIISAAQALGQTNPQQQPGAKAPTLLHLSLDELGDVEVTTASKTPEVLRRTPAAIYVITSDAIRRSGATSLPELLRLAPGVNVARIDSDHWAVGIRGFGDQFSKSVLVLIDGRNVYTPLFGGIQWGVQDTLIEDIERIEVIRGPGATVWGANAMNGVINVITKSSRDTTGVLAAIGAGNVDLAIGSARYGASRGPNFSYRVYGKAFKRGPQFHTDGTDFDRWHMGQAGVRLDWGASDSRDQVTVTGDAYAATQGQSVVFGSFSPPRDIISHEPLDLSGGNVALSWRHRFAEGNDAQLNVYYDRTSLLAPQLGESRHTVDVDLVHHTSSFARQDVRWGVGLRVSPSQFQQTVPTLDIVPNDQTYSIYSAFAQDELTLVRDRLALTIGAKIERNNFTGAEVQPSGRLIWTPTTRQSLWTALTRAVRTPSHLEEGLVLTRFLTVTPLPTFLQVVGNPAFDVEQNVGFEAGYRVALGERVFLDLAAYRNRHDKLQSFGQPTVSVVTTPAPGRVLFVLPYTNGAGGTSKGFELAADSKLQTWAQVKMSYSYLDLAIRNTQPVEDILNVVRNYNGSSPRHQLVLQPLLTLPGGWEIDPLFRYVSALPARAIPSYRTLDARVAWPATPSFDVAATVQGMLSKHHLEFVHDPGPNVAIRRAAFLSATWRR